MSANVSTYGKVLSNQVVSTWLRGAFIGTGNARDLKLSAHNEGATNEFTALLQHNVGTSTLTFSKTGSTAVRVTGVDATPTAASDVANKKYVDDVAQGLDVKEAVHAASTADIPGTYFGAGANGVGDTFTVTATGVLTVDGVTLALGNRLLLKDQTSQQHNGIYTVTTAGAVGVQAVLTRSIDFDTVSKMNPGSFTFVQAGTTNANAGYVLTSLIATVGTSNAVFSKFAGTGAITAGPGININGSVVKVLVKNVGTNPVLGYTNGTASSTTAGDDLRLLSRTGYNGSMLVSGAAVTDDPVFSYVIGPNDATSAGNGLVTIAAIASRTSAGTAATDGGFILANTNSTTNGNFSPGIYIGDRNSTGSYRSVVYGDGTNQTYIVQRHNGTAYTTLFSIEP